MTIITSAAIVEDTGQADGRRHIREGHAEVDGPPHDFCWMAEGGQDATAGLAARAAWLETELPEREVEANTDAESVAEMTFRYCTPLQTAHRLRQKFPSASGADACRMAGIFLAQTDTRLRTAFGLTQPQVMVLKTRLQLMVDKCDAINAVEGE